MSCGIAIVGTGMIARHQASAIREARGAHLAAVVSRSEERAGAFATDAGCNGYTSLSEALEDPEVRVVSICTPSGAHLEPALEAIRAGRHVIVEKPLEISLERCDQIINAADRRGVQVGGIFQSRFFEASRVLKSAAEAGRFGDIVLADAYVKWYRPSSYYRNGGWKGTARYDGGGALMNQSIHAVDLLLWIAGPVSEVRAFKDVRGHHGIEVEDTAVAALRFDSGAMGVIEGSTAIYPGFLKRIEISGTAGTAILEEEALRTWTFEEESENDDEIRHRLGSANATGGGASDPGAIGVAGHRRQFEEFVAALEAGRSVELDGVEARKPVALIQSIYESAETGRTVRVPR